jgi:hypothetical protein
MGYRRRNRGRADWPAPPAEYLISLAENVRQARRQSRQDARRGGFTLGLAPAAIVAVVLALAGIVGAGTATGAGGGVVHAVASIVVNSGPSSSANADSGQYDQYDTECEGADQELRTLDRQQLSERQLLLQAQTAPHRGLSGDSLRAKLVQERHALEDHQQAARRVLSAKQDRCDGEYGNGEHGGDHDGGGNGEHGGGNHDGGGND